MKKTFSNEELQQKVISFAQDNISLKNIKSALKKAPHLKTQIENFKTITQMVEDSLNNTYNLDKKTLSIFIGSIIYVLTPIDLIPDFLLGIGWLDDIAVIAWLINKFSPVISLYQSSKKLINKHIDTIIEQNVNDYLQKINTQINKQLASLRYQFLFETIFLALLLIAYYYYPNIPIKQVLYIFIACRIGVAFSKSMYSTIILLNKLQFFSVSKIFIYLKTTKNIKEAIILDMKNFYEYHYELQTSSSIKNIHHIGNIAQLTPDNEEIFNRILEQLKKDIPIYLKHRIQILVLFFIFYIITLSAMRHIILYYY